MSLEEKEEPFDMMIACYCIGMLAFVTFIIMLGFGG